MSLMDFFRGSSMKLVSRDELQIWLAEYNMMRSGISFNMDEMELAEVKVWMKWMEVESKEMEKEMRKWQRNLH